MRKLMKPALALVMCGLLLMCVFSCRGISIHTFYANGSVASISPIATDISVSLFRQGANAFDVAVAVGFVLAVVHPQAGNIGGGGFAVVHDGATGQVRALDFRETAPAAATEKMFLEANGTVRDQASTFGALAAAVPGTPAGLYELWREHGSMSWEELVRIAADLADSGFVVDAWLADDFRDNEAKLAAFSSTTEAYFVEGRIPQSGDRLVLPDLAATLYALAAEGPDAFYQGETARLIDSTMRLHGGIMTAEDLAAYRPVWREPLHFTFDSLDIYSMPPPSSGGIVVGQILGLLEPLNTSAWNSRHPAFLQRFIEASRLAFADRAEHMGDPDYWDVPGTLLDDVYLDSRREMMPIEVAGSSERTGAGITGAVESEQTTHFSVCDRYGNMVALTYTLNTNFGSKLVVDGAGFFLNNEMDDFSIAPGVPNTYGLVGGEANRIEPGKRMLSSMSPTLVLVNRRPDLILGSPGGSRIISTVALALFNYARFGLPIEDCVAHPRIHHQWLPDNVQVEQGGFPPSILAALRGYGYELVEREPYSDLQVIKIGSAGLMQAASDPRHGGKADGL